MTVTEGRVRVAPTGDELDTTVVTQTDGTKAHREAVVITDPETLAARAAVLNAEPSSTDYGAVTRPIISQAYWAEVVKGNVPGSTVVHKFGTNPAIGTSFVPISIGGIYRTPQVAGATTLRIKAGDANDAAGGSGARLIELQGLDETGALVTEQVPTAGAAAGAPSTTTFIRLFRAFIAESGTYATQSAGSHAADIVIENGAGTEDWLTIAVAGFPRAQSQVGVYSVPLGKTAYLNSFFFSIDSSKLADVVLFKREGILETVAPYSAMRMQQEFNGLIRPFDFVPKIPAGPFPELTDVGFMAKVSLTTGAISVDFELLLIDD